MPFTDDDVKRLKERCGSGYLPILNDQGKGFALLARLEAAEDYIEGLELNGFDDRDSKEYGETWRKACGRDK